MNGSKKTILIGDTTLKRIEKAVRGEYVSLLGEPFYKIENFQAMEPFFMTVVSSSDHWLFISSNGGLSAGRGSADQALFPYYTEDKITDNSEQTGSKAVLLVRRSRRTSLWEPLSVRQQGVYSIRRDLYRNIRGTALVFEEHNLDLGLTYRYAWRTSERFGFIKTTWLVNTGASPCQVELLDGLQNILPANITELTQNTFSCLLDAYKRNEVDPRSGLAIFGLNSRLTDQTEPSESLLATTVAQLGLAQADYLLSSLQLDRFRAGNGLSPETDLRGRRGAYFVHTTLKLAPRGECTWHLMADVQQDSAAIARQSQWLRGERATLIQELESDIAAGQSSLWKMVASADGLQVSGNPLCSAHHYANVMFNGMRGGIFLEGYRVHRDDFIEFVFVRNRTLLDEEAAFFSELPSELTVMDLQARAEASGSEDLIRVCYGYLPLSFSRRHGDPSRPWNRFTIDIKKPDGSPKLTYEGNWRDIFQNWEALAHSFPEYVESMICTFLNATTADGYNPYRITRQGIDWEQPQPGNPWANIGYWSDHQIIYLQKLMEISAKLHPGKLQAFLSQAMFSYANVPYRLKPMADLQRNPYNTIDFDWDVEREIESLIQERGTDGKLARTRSGGVFHATLAEKLLTLLLAKLANFIPEGGIWMNTQRPEWNDANNALVGKGLSVVTLCYLRRYVVFFKELSQRAAVSTVRISREVWSLYSQIHQILAGFQDLLPASFSDEQRRLMMDALGQAGSDYRWNYYSRGFSGESTQLPVAELVEFLDLTQQYVEHSLRANKRSDNLYHAYNVLQLDDRLASISHLNVMLEGQVAILSASLLTGEESLLLLESLRHSQLYRPDQHSYILYPNRDLPGFLEKNCMTPDRISHLALVSELVRAQDKTLITRDLDGNYHFSGQIRNSKDVARSLEALEGQPRYADLVTAEAEKIKALFEDVFHHAEFTGRSGTFFAYEGLGSVYWHMVTKLLLAVQETILRTRSEPATKSLMASYNDIRQGLSFNKAPDVYGAFPTDPYSHTPQGQGAKQPGMTGSVKEEILTRQVELGYSIENGHLVFDFLLLDRNEFLTDSSLFSYWSIDGQQQQMELQAGSIAYSICQVPVILQASNETCIKVHMTDGSTQQMEGYVLDSVNSKHIFQRDGMVHHLQVYLVP
jgi:hypothetical protein